MFRNLVWPSPTISSFTVYMLLSLFRNFLSWRDAENLWETGVEVIHECKCFIPYIFGRTLSVKLRLIIIQCLNSRMDEIHSEINVWTLTLKFLDFYTSRCRFIPELLYIFNQYGHFNLTLQYCKSVLLFLFVVFTSVLWVVNLE